MRVRTLPLLASLFVAAGCGPPVPGPGSAAASPVVSVEPSAELSAVPSVVHLHVASRSLGAGDALLFQGSLSDYYLSKVKHSGLKLAIFSMETIQFPHRGGHFLW